MAIKDAKGNEITVGDYVFDVHKNMNFWVTTRVLHSLQLLRNFDGKISNLNLVLAKKFKEVK